MIRMKYSAGKINILLSFFLVLALSLFTSVPAHSQVSGATLSGTVTDASGSAIPNATVSIKNTATGIIREVTTDAAGFYSAPNLPPAVYEIKTSAAGFSTAVQPSVTLTVGAQQTLNTALQVGQISQNVTVTSEAPQVELTSSALSGQVNETTVRELPLNGRDWTSLSTLEPGVIGIRTQTTTTGTVSRGNRGFGNQLSVSGHRPTENNYRVNGITVNDYSNGSPGSVQGSQLGVDAIQEFSVLTANYTAEYGRTSGGVINAITKAGTNSFHGDAYWFLRDEGLDARPVFAAAGSPNPFFHRNQFGGSAGGPIQKGKTFIFGDFEAIRQLKNTSASSTVPSAAIRMGTLCSALGPTDPCPDGGTGPHQITGAFNPDPTTGIDVAALKYLPLFPLPTPGLPLSPTGDTGSFTAPTPIVFTENYATARVDHHFSDKDDLDAVWFFDRSFQDAPDAFLLSTTGTFSERIMGGLEWTHTFGATLVNTARVGYNRTVGFVGAPGSVLNPIANDTSFSDGYLAGHPSPIIAIGGLPFMQGGLGSQTLNNHYGNSYQFYDDAFYIHGNHEFKFGFAVERIQYNELSVQRPNGTFTFNGGLLAFLLNQPSSFQQGDSSVEKELGTRATIFAGYLQDNWKFRPNLTLNLGMRYEIETLPTEAHYGFTVVPSPDISAAPINVPHPWQTNPTLRNFEPRVGFAWDPFKDGKTSIRGGFGIFDVLPGPWVINVQESGSLPFASTVISGTLPVGSFPTLTGVTLGSSSAQAYGPEQDPKRNYAMNWNLTVQRQLTSTLTATIGYVGSHTLHSPFTTDTSNSVGPPQVMTTPFGLQWPCGPDSAGNACAVGFLPSGTQASPVPTTVFNSHVGQLRPTFWMVGSRYNALEAQLTKRFGHGVQGEASFTWGKCFDSGSSGDIGDGYQNSPSSLIFFNPGGLSGLCDFNVTRNFVGNLVWDVPSPKSSSWAVTHLAGGWELGGIVTASTGTPFTLTMGDPMGINNGDSLGFPNRLAGCNPISPNYRTTLQYVNTACFTPPTVPTASVASLPYGCAPFTGAGIPAAPSGQTYCANMFGNNGRNSLVGPGLFNLDFSVFKNNYIPRISESFNAQFRVEMFNVLNHANFQQPLCCSAIFNQDGSPASSAGQLSTTAADNREIQLSLKVIW
jgi:Carboxypeptidase regulatory-like domain/TonB dependent receptor-like, beta-barrel/TonB-dependent Receptor Plug Domain